MRRAVWLVAALGAVALSDSRAANAVTRGGGEPRAMLLADAASGLVLRQHAADEPVALGSLGQLMIALLVSEQVQSGRLSVEQPLPVSAAAVGEPGVQLALRAGDDVMLQEVLRALIVTGAPDAEFILAEAIAGSVEAAVALMNERAATLGMKATKYYALRASARLPASVTTAGDTARVVTELLRYPRMLEWAALSGIPFHGGAVLLRSRNQMLGAVAGVNGLLVSDVPRDGFHLVATARRGALQLIAITLGAQDNGSRYETTASWLEWGFANYDRVEIVRAGDPLPVAVQVRAGAEDEMVPVAGAGCSLLRRRDEEHHFEIGFQVPDVLAAPVARNQRVGELIVRERGQLLAVVPAMSPGDIAVLDGARAADAAEP